MPMSFRKFQGLLAMPFLDVWPQPVLCLFPRHCHQPAALIFFIGRTCCRRRRSLLFCLLFSSLREQYLLVVLLLSEPFGLEAAERRRGPGEPGSGPTGPNLPP